MKKILSVFLSESPSNNIPGRSKTPLGFQPFPMLTMAREKKMAYI